MSSSYGHFCLAARTLETVGDRWSLLVVRDLLGGPRRFGELQRLLTNVTPKWLTIRLRQLEAAGIVVRHQRPGRREVRYELTEKGRDLEPVLEALLAWGFKHERHALGPDETAHPEHLMAGMTAVLNDLMPPPSGPRAWRFSFARDEPAFDLVFDGERWASGEASGDADVVVETTPRAWARFITAPRSRRRLPTRDIRVTGDRRHVEAFAGALTQS
jgi:DNA-binding HxlR family transcriptional regulator